MESTKNISIDTYDYELPEERIARFPLEVRDTSKLLLYKQGKIDTAVFKELPQHLPDRTLLLFNDTKVIHARLHFKLPNGSKLEILCLEPLTPAEYQQNFSSREKVHWKCMVGGNRKWKSGEINKEVSTEAGIINLKASRLGRVEDAFEICFEWDNEDYSFGELLAEAGIIPLPPYLKRDAEPSDKGRYQTVYAREEGSVAAPTAGLHFTEDVFETLDKKGIEREFITLHVGAGTFKPVKADRLEGHHMHEETIYIKRSQLEQILNALKDNRPIIPVGTTSMRLLESLYWHGVQLLNGNPSNTINVRQWDPYETDVKWKAIDAINAILEALEKEKEEILQGQTQIIIAPGYAFRLAKGLITNFHQPRSTLLLLIAALIGNDWKTAYQYALSQDFRFLSYGDSSLLLP